MMVKKVGQTVELVDLPNKYDTLKDAVGGYIECVRLEKGVILWCNEEGKLLDLPHNFTVGNIRIEGDVIFTGDDYKGGNVSLKQKQIDYITGLLNKKPSAYQEWLDRFFEEEENT